jgi:hypothetical protein
VHMSCKLLHDPYSGMVHVGMVYTASGAVAALWTGRANPELPKGVSLRWACDWEIISDLRAR